MFRLVLHHALKDVRLLSRVLVAWLLLNVVLHAVVLLGAYRYAPGTDQGGALEVAFNALMGLNVAGFVAIAVLVMQTDPAVSVTAFWRTRPVSVNVLLAVKSIVLVAAVVILPVACDAVTMLLVGAQAGYLLATCWFALLLQVAWLLPVIAIAAITTTLAQFVAAAAAEVAGGVLVLTTFEYLKGASVVLPSSAAFGILVGVLALALITIAYVRRDAGDGSTVACLAPLVLCAALSAWPHTASTTPASRPLNAVHAVRERSVDVALVPGAGYSLAGSFGEVLSAKVTDRGYEVAVRQSGAGFNKWRAFYSVRNARGEFLHAGALTVNRDPFVTLFIPVPQHVSVMTETLVFPWVERPDTDLQTWLKGAVLVVTER